MKIVFGFLVFVFITSLGWSQERIEFIYEFEKDGVQPYVHYVKARIINKTDKDIYFLSETCNGLDYYLTTNKPNATVYINLNCNSTFPMKNLLEANSCFEFKSMIKVDKNVEEVSLSLEFIELKASAEAKDGDRSSIRKKENIINTTLIKGPLVKL